MAQSRLQYIGTIFTRMRSLIHGEVIHENDKPLWFDVYQAFPPKYEPRYDNVITDIPIRRILYKEDTIRSRFHKDNKFLTYNLLDKKCQSKSQKFIKTCQQLQKDGMPEEEIYKKALKDTTKVKAERHEGKPNLDEKSSDVDNVNLVLNTIFNKR
ncbi:28S ribosomal protein S23, mitochondrial isoform X1 [Orussus abietinus]|uniref:28S ribosomal protein S23, mitochondrial isoform X1 n=1 Tax=Orussus abietinus TaxID=222816 RepID=UPI0006254A5F|nr:28S ribosomal protein S23, mitochondrial isoform X1 [Orussus abietinus]